MNVMKQDAMDDKIIERCKICENQCMQEGLDRLEVVELLSRENLEILMDRGSVEKLTSLIKTVFQGEKHKNKCNQANYSTKDLKNILILQKHLSTRRM